MSSRALIVGASGQVGAQLLSLLGPDRALPTARGARDRKGWIELDLSTLSNRQGFARDLIRQHSIDAIYCAGAATDVDGLESNEEMALQTNCLGPAALAAAAHQANCGFLYFSSDYIFNGASGPYSEEDLPDPLCVYGMSKWKGELAVRRAHPGAIIIRTTVVYGPDPREKNFLYTLRRFALREEPLRVAHDQFSTPTYSPDLAGAAIRLMESGATGVFHVCGRERLSRLEFAQRSAAMMGLDTSRITGVSTAELMQRAKRPLEGGLLTTKLQTLYPDLRLRSIDDAVPDFMAS